MKWCRLTLRCLLVAWWGAVVARGDVVDAAGHWSFQPARRPAVPAVQVADWARTPVDRFIQVRMETEGARPMPEASRRVLLRRLSFDLRGLPPTPEEMDAFLADARPDAWAQWVERFLASSAYGESWGRHWLDVAGYADSNGYFNADSDRPWAWQYRDYVVRAFNTDRPFDRFILEQVAGDELVGYVGEGDLTPEMVEPLIATHFFRNAPDGTGESDGNPLEVKVDKYTVLEGNVQLIGHAFLGLTLQCARCHDHKFEPVKQSEYYGLEAILRPAFDPEHWRKPNERVVSVGTRSAREAHRRATEAAEGDLKAYQQSLDGLAVFRRRAIESNLASLDDAARKAVVAAVDTKEKDRTDAMKTLLREHASQVEVSDATLKERFPEYAAARRELELGLAKAQAARPEPLPKIAATYEPGGTLPVHHLLLRGNHANEGPETPPCVPAALGALSPEAFWTRVSLTPGTDQAATNSSSGRRLALARWLTAPDHPLVARLWVNRVWQQHFGTGLVPTVDNLGKSGARPTHPDLLDWLAVEFVESGWSVKHLHRLILNSATWRQSSVDGEPALGAPAATSLARDERKAVPASGLYVGFPLRRLEAEALRDAVLAASGELDRTVGGHYVPLKVDPDGQILVDETRPDALRRSLYLQQRRTQPIGWLEVFDGPQPNPVCIQRSASTVALQSLSLLNSDFIRRRSRAMANRVLAETADVSASSNAPALRRACEFAWNRPAAPDEQQALEQFLRDQTVRYADQPEARLRAWTDLCQMLLASNAFLHVE